MDKLYTKAQIEKTDKGLVAVASTAVEDRHGEVVEVSGWELKNFKKNPVLLWGHQHDIPAIGIAKNLRVDGEGKKAKLLFEPVFHEATEFARALKAMVEELGVLNSFSVGFMPMDMDGNRYTKQELLEISLVNVPANPEARVMAYKGLEAKGFDKGVLESLGLTQEEPGDDVQSKLAVMQAKYEELADKYEDVVKGLQSLNPRVDRRETSELRVSLAKVIGRATDKMLTGPKPQADRVALKVIKRANDRLTYDLKRDLHSGKNQRTS